MQPFSRETIVDRRQPTLRWTAVLAGSAVAIASWLLLQLFGSGIALSVLDTRDWDRVRAVGIGSSAWSVVALAFSLFVGGLLAGRIDGHHEKRVAGLHGLLVWAVTAIVGVVSVTSSIAMMTPPFGSHAYAGHSEEMRTAVIDAANTTGFSMLIASLALVLGAVAAIAGALVAAQQAMRVRRRHDTIPGHTTAPYPIPSDVPPPPAD
jgi:MFS family permease